MNLNLTLNVTLQGPSTFFLTKHNFLTRKKIKISKKRFVKNIILNISVLKYKKYCTKILVLKKYKKCKNVKM